MSARDTNTEDRAKSKRVGALAGLWPFVAPYRGMLGLALAALVATAAISLVLPIAVRRVVDGFQTSAVVLLDSYFIAALAVALNDPRFGDLGQRKSHPILQVSAQLETHPMLVYLGA
jgi:hypothetical protein